jgi:hypothetical protein
MFLDGVAPGARCGIIGASTKELVEAAVERRAAVTVFDFSPVMLADLAAEVGEGTCAYVRLDALEAVPEALRGSFRFVLADRLVNRFTRQEVPTFLRNVLALLDAGGELRMTVKLGLYPMDSLLIEEGRRRGTLSRFYDDETRTIDYASAAGELAACLVPHGSIPRATLLDWYVRRGKESRLEREPVSAMILEAGAGPRHFGGVEEADCPDAPGTVMFTARVAVRARAGRART